MRARRRLLAVLACLAAVPATASDRRDAPGYGDVRDHLSTDRSVVRQAVGRLAGAGGQRLVPAIVDALFFIPAGRRGPAIDLLRSLTGENRGSRYLVV